MEYKLGNTIISLAEGDITQEETDAIANAANNALQGGGGVDGAIHRAAGPELLEACRKIGNCPTGQAVITEGFKLKSRYVIHTVGPIYSGSADDPKLLASCYKESLQLALDHNLRSVAFPSISTGVYGYPLQEAAPIALNSIYGFVQKHPDALDMVRMTLFDQRTLMAYQNAAEKIF